MKKLFFITALICLLVLPSCEVEEASPKTTYQVFNNSESFSTQTDPYLNGSMYDVIVFCFAGDDIVREDNYTKIAVGEITPMKEVPESVTKIKVSFKFVPEQSEYYDLSSNYRRYLVSYTLVEIGKNVISEINGDSMIKGSLVKQHDESIISKVIEELK